MVLRFSMSVVTESVCGPTVQYVRHYRECLWTYGSVCPSSQGVSMVLRFSMYIVNRVRYWVYESGCPMSKGKFLIGLIVQDSHLYMEFPGLNGSRCPSLRGEEIITLMKTAQRKVTGLCSCYIFRIMPLEGALISSRNAKSFVFTDDQQ
jgi:hypothetical protein